MAKRKRSSRIKSKEKAISKESKKILSQEEVNTLEKMVERNEGKMDLTQIKEILKDTGNEPSVSSPAQKVSPSLQKINPPQRNPVRLEQTFPPDTMQIPGTESNQNKEDGGFKYLPGRTGEGNEPKYIQYEDKTNSNLTSIKEMEKISRLSPFQTRELKFESSIGSRTPMSSNVENYTLPRKIDKEETLKEKPFERREVKYTPGKY